MPVARAVGRAPARLSAVSTSELTSPPALLLVAHGSTDPAFASVVEAVAEQDATYGKDLWARDPDLCCRLRKVLPLRKALAPYMAWASGVMRAETEARKGIGLVEWDSTNGMVKVNPLAAWTQDDVDRYVHDNGLLSNPLLSDGYGSIGCAPCTRRGNGRSGRWTGTGKVECGIHA